MAQVIRPEIRQFCGSVKSCSAHKCNRLVKWCTGVYSSRTKHDELGCFNDTDVECGDKEENPSNEKSEQMNEKSS